jgi:hypothetical protein
MEGLHRFAFSKTVHSPWRSDFNRMESTQLKELELEALAKFGRGRLEGQSS